MTLIADVHISPRTVQFLNSIGYGGCPYDDDAVTGYAPATTPTTEA